MNKTGEILHLHIKQNTYHTKKKKPTCFWGNHSSHNCFVTHSAAGKLCHDNTKWPITNPSLVIILSSDVKDSRQGKIYVFYFHIISYFQEDHVVVNI